MAVGHGTCWCIHKWKGNLWHHLSAGFNTRAAQGRHRQGTRGPHPIECIFVYLFYQQSILGQNCTKREMRVNSWENPDTVLLSPWTLHFLSPDSSALPSMDLALSFLDELNVEQPEDILWMAICAIYFRIKLSKQNLRLHDVMYCVVYNCIYSSLPYFVFLTTEPMCLIHWLL